MIKLIVGTKGSGKTKAMIDMINDSVKTSKGNVVVGAEHGEALHRVGCALHDVVDADAGSSDGQQAHSGKDGVAAADIVGDDEGGPALSVSQLLEGALGAVGGGVDPLVGLFHAHLVFQQLAQHTEGQRGLGGGAGLGDDVDGEALALAQRDDVIQIGGADAVAAEVDLQAVVQLVVVHTLDGLDDGACAQIAAADAGDHQNVRILTDLGSSCLDALELFLIIITGQIHPAQEVAAGINIDDVMKGAADAMERFSVLSPDNDAYKYAAIRNILYRKGKSIEILECYEPNFTLMNEWYKQLFGESEGKDNKGLFPASCIFSTDLHSMGQFIQEGSRTMFETIVDVKKPAQDLFIDKLEGNFDGLNFLADQNMSVVNRKAMEGTILAHTDGGVPEVVIEVDDLSAYNVGYLIYFFWRACACSGYLLSVNPFNQPGVESYKKNMFALLGKPGYENLTAELEAKLK